MNNLKQLQNRFQNYLLNPESDIQNSWVSATGRASPGFQLAVYANAYVSRLKEVLKNDYPAASAAIGGDRFDRLVQGYIHQYPSRYFSLRDFGCSFAAYIKALVEDDPCYRDLAWLSELARFEWLLGQAFDAAETELVTEHDLACVPAEHWPLLRFVFSPCMFRIDLEWNVPVLWKALTAEPPLEVEVVPAESGSAWLIWRQDLITRFRSLEYDEQAFLDALLSGVSFNDACEALATRIDVDAVPMRAASLVKGWIQQGLIAEIGYADFSWQPGRVPSSRPGAV
ncbi:MAG: DNA-binding domain-containing protein [Candidatus Thiodiazotropha sp.]